MKIFFKIIIHQSNKFVGIHEIKMVSIHHLSQSYLIKVNVISLKSFQTGFTVQQNVLSTQPNFIWTISHLSPYFSCYHKVLSLLAKTVNAFKVSYMYMYNIHTQIYGGNGGCVCSYLETRKKPENG